MIGFCFSRHSIVPGDFRSVLTVVWPVLDQHCRRGIPISHRVGIFVLSINSQHFLVPPKLRRVLD